MGNSGGEWEMGDGRHGHGRWTTITFAVGVPSINDILLFFLLSVLFASSPSLVPLLLVLAASAALPVCRPLFPLFPLFPIPM